MPHPQFSGSRVADYNVTLLSRYILKEYLRVFLITACSLAVITFAIDFIEKVRGFQEFDPEFSWLLKYFLLRQPRVFLELLPLAVLLSTLVTFGGLAKTSEITAFKSTGISVYRLAMPVLLVGIFISLFSFYLKGTLVPTLFRRSNDIKFVEIQKQKRPSAFSRHQAWIHLDSRRLLHAELVSADMKKMQGIRLYLLGDDFDIQSEVSAKDLVYQDNQWVLLNGVERTFDADGAFQFLSFSKKIIQINKKPEDFEQTSLEQSEMTVEYLQSYADELKAVGFDARGPLVDMRAKQALPFVNFLMVLLGVPFALKDNRSAGIGGGIIVSLAVALFYYIVFSIGLSLGRLGIFSPWLGAWSANILIFFVASYLFVNIRQ